MAVTVDQVGLVVKQRRPGSPSGGWQTHVELVWQQVRALAFHSDSRDPVVALYAVTNTGRLYLLDAGHLTRQQWAELAANIAGLTSSRITLNLSARDRTNAITDS